MTFAEWRAKYPEHIRGHISYPNGLEKVFLANSAPVRPRWEIFRLSDYVVSSAVSGPSYNLVPRAEG